MKIITIETLNDIVLKNKQTICYMTMSSMLNSCEVFSETLQIQKLSSVINMCGTVTYISIGCSCEIGWSIEDDQQYPIFIRNFKKYNDDIAVNLVLIDPILDRVNCFDERLGKNKIASHGNLVCTNVNGRNVCYNNVHMCDNNITIYKFNAAISYIPDILPTQQHLVDITDVLETLNARCFLESGILIVHDFSGRDIRTLDMYFSYYTSTFSNRIVYDISGGEQDGCFIDMSDPINHINIISTNRRLTIDNVNKTSPYVINFIINDKTKKRYTEVSIKKLKRRKRYIYKEFMFYIHNLRRILLWNKSLQTKRDTDTCYKVIKQNELMLIDTINKTHLVESLRQMDLRYLMETMIHIVEQKRKEIEVLFETILKLDMDSPMKWMDEIDKISTDK